MSVDEKEKIVEQIAAEGARAYAVGDGIPSCPYGLTQFFARCAWLAGYRDAERGMA